MPPRSDASSASMNSTFSLSSSNISSPSRHSPARKSPRSNGVVTPQVKPFNYESPSRPITSDYEEMLGRSEREYRKKLDEEEAERARLYRAQVAKAAAERYRVNEDCGLEIERLKLEEETEDMRRRAAQEKEVQRLKVQKQKEQAEARQRELEAKLREEQIAREAAENQRKQQEAEERVRAEKERAETAQRKQEQDERKAKEVAAAPPPPARPVQPTLPAQASPAPAVAAAPVAPITAATQSASSPPSRDIVRVHEKYLALHRNMKQFRKQLLEAHKAAGSPLKKFIGEIRRNMVKRMGQLTIDVKDSKVVATRIRSECFDEAINANGPKIDIRPFLVSHQIANDADAHYPALLLYAWICFEKNLIAQWYNEASKEDGRIIQQLSLVAASMYLDPKYMCNGSIPMSDTLLAKLHRICPVMFGIRGDTGKNRAGLGLDNIHNDESNMNRYAQRMTAVGAGYGALTHKKPGGKLPAIPISEYWRSVVLICNTPADALYPGHFLVLQGLLRDNVRKFLLTYGVAAMAVLRRATIDLPARVPVVVSGTPEAHPGLAAAANLVKVLPDVWQKKENINIKRPC